MNQSDKVTSELSAAADNYWDYVPAMIASALRSNRDLDEYIHRYRALIDFGVAPTQLAEVGNSLPTLPKKNASLKILFVSDWMKHFIATITQKEERDRLMIKEKKLNGQMKLIIHDLARIQAERKLKLDAIFDFNEYRGRVYQQLINSLTMVDTIKFDSLIKNEAMSKGRYFGVEERRTLASERQWLNQQERKIEALLCMIEDRETRIVTTNMFAEINEKLQVQLELRRQIDTTAERRFALDEEIAAIPVDTISAKISEKVLKIKQLIVEDTTRVGGETGVFRRAKEQLIDIELLNSELLRIIEFDREIFANNHSTKFGLPAVLLVPGKGDGMYSPQDHLIILPMIPNFNLGESIASAFVSYRLYHDETKQLIRSYGRLPNNSTVTSPYTLRLQLVKSYSKWVTMEYEGYHVIDKDERAWFGQGMSPKKGDFYIPFEMLRGTLHGEQYNELTTRINDSLRNGNIRPEDLWFASIISCKRGEYEKAELQIKKLIGMSSDYIFAHFNMGILMVKANKDALALDHFTRFISGKPPKWWASTAQEFVVALKNQDKKA